ncbi:myocardin-related transcription factor A isoform X2 [Cylas formicarius]|nr:myocardin-related transcription factor A isoform X2 [Cylas formicarius]XP_060535380.1 myocardin-related transcription factor A isoform X2 [Cylas formicarius]XP_060535381.1 myocardin-related transcription factor A isoform X2 [Cylas formicarius]
MEGGGSAGGGQSPARDSPPKAVIDTSPILMDQNKESLKVKLLLRRPFDQLVAQGIMPPHKTPAVYHGQRRQLERAKTGDMLKAKIQQRPPRQELERRHILEADANHADPSLAERQRMLKKARLADQLNDQLSHRPGPLELIQKNILHTEEPIEQAVKTGRIPYKATSEGQLNRPQHPQNYVNPEEDSQSSEGGDNVSPGPSDVLETAAKSAGIVVSLLQPADGTVVVTPVLKQEGNEIVFAADLCRSVLPQGSSPASLVSSTSTLSPLSSVASPVPSIVSQPATPAPPPPPPPPIALASRPKCDAPGKDKNNRKKSKSKSVPKARTIKFHEYKGPPSAQKSPAGGAQSGESSYDLLLKQQTLLLQFQLQLQHKYPQIILPASQKTEPQASNPNAQQQQQQQQPSPAPSTSSECSVAPGRISVRLEDMKVSDLKAELKRRSLPVSGSKPQLIERLKPFAASPDNNLGHTVDSSSMDHSHNSPPFQDLGSPHDSLKEEPSSTDLMEVGEAASPAPSQDAKTNEDIVREQQRQIEELQRELTLSQLKLQAATRIEPKAQMVALQKHLQARQQQQQQQQNLALQMRQLQALQSRQAARVDEEQQRLQQQQHVAFQNQKNLAGLVLNGTDAAMMFNQLMQGKAKVANGHYHHARTNSLPNFLSDGATPLPDVKAEPTEKDKKDSVKSQIVDDVLEILIKNGELPPSAANDPATPQLIKQQEPEYPTDADAIDVNGLGIDPADILDTLDNLDGMDFSQFVMEMAPADNNNVQAAQVCDVVPMDTDDWLESLLPGGGNNNYGGGGGGGGADLGGYDPLLAVSQDPFDPFNLEEFRSTADLAASISWDKIDYAT